MGRSTNLCEQRDQIFRPLDVSSSEPIFGRFAIQEPILTVQQPSLFHGLSRTKMIASTLEHHRFRHVHFGKRWRMFKSKRQELE